MHFTLFTIYWVYLITVTKITNKIWEEKKLLKLYRDADCVTKYDTLHNYYYYFTVTKNCYIYIVIYWKREEVLGAGSD